MEAVKSLDTLVKFIIDMAIDHEGNDWKKKVCPELTSHEGKLDDVEKMLMELMNPDTSLKYQADTGLLLFNNQDVTNDVGQILDTFTDRDSKKIGFLYGNMLD